MFSDIKLTTARHVQVLLALEYLHCLGFIYRDLKVSCLSLTVCSLACSESQACTQALTAWPVSQAVHGHCRRCVVNTGRSS